MKKILTILSVAMMAMCATALFSCSNDDSNSGSKGGGGDTPKTKDAVAVVVAFHADHLSLFTPTVTVTDSKGTAKTMSLNELTKVKTSGSDTYYTVKLKTTNFPVTVKVNTACKMSKDQLEDDKEYKYGMTLVAGSANYADADSYSSLIMKAKITEGQNNGKKMKEDFGTSGKSIYETTASHCQAKEEVE